MAALVTAIGGEEKPEEEQIGNLGPIAPPIHLGEG